MQGGVRHRNCQDLRRRSVQYSLVSPIQATTKKVLVVVWGISFPFLKGIHMMLYHLLISQSRLCIKDLGTSSLFESRSQAGRKGKEANNMLRS